MPSQAHRKTDREQLLDRLQNLRSILPVFATELAAARRQAARLRVENAQLVEQVRRLPRQRMDSAPTRARTVLAGQSSGETSMRRRTPVDECATHFDLPA